MNFILLIIENLYGSISITRQSKENYSHVISIVWHRRLYMHVWADDHLKGETAAVHKLILNFVNTSSLR